MLFLHVPHTSGRGIGRFLWNHQKDHKIDYKKIHNAKDFETIFSNINNLEINNIIKYFVVRDPIERSYKEFIHYSKNLGKIGIVNHLKLSEIKKNNPKFDHTDPFDYLDLEVNKNVYCKFLLFRTDFTIPITEEDYLKIDINKFYYDLFTDLPELSTLSKLIDMNVNLPTFSFNPIDIPEDIKNFIIMNNQYDIKLINQILISQKILKTI